MKSILIWVFANFVRQTLELPTKEVPHEGEKAKRIRKDSFIVCLKRI